MKRASEVIAVAAASLEPGSSELGSEGSARMMFEGGY